MAIECALVVSDLHVLSTYALLRPGWKTSEGNEIGLNPVQQWLWTQFLSCLDEVDRYADGSEYALILLGDMIEGNHHRTKDILHVDDAEHAIAAIYTLAPLVERAKTVYVLEGTESHTGNMEAWIGKEIAAEKNPTTGKYVFDRLDINIKGCPCNFRHHMPTSSRVYLEASQLAIQLGNAQLAAQRSGDVVPKLIGAGHRHTPGLYTDGTAMMFAAPCWQALTRYGRKVVPDGQLRPGFVWLDWRKRPEGGLPDAQLIIRQPEPRARVTPDVSND